MKPDQLSTILPLSIVNNYAASFPPTEVSTEGHQVKICTDVMELARVG